MNRMAGELMDNKGRGEAGWSWPPIHPEGRKFGLIAGALSVTGTLSAPAAATESDADVSEPLVAQAA